MEQKINEALALLSDMEEEYDGDDRLPQVRWLLLGALADMEKA